MNIVFLCGRLIKPFLVEGSSLVAIWVASMALGGSLVLAKTINCLAFEIVTKRGRFEIETIVFAI